MGFLLSPFLIQKTRETHCKPISIKKAMNSTIIIQATNPKQSKKILKWRQFGKLNIKTHPHLALNFSKGVIKSPDIASCSLEEIRPHLKPQGVTDIRRISICKEIRIIDTNTYILTIKKGTTPPSIRIDYINTKIETLYDAKNMDILEINTLDHQYVQNQITQNVKFPLTASTAKEKTLCTHGNVKCRKMNNKIHKKRLFP